MTAFFVHLIIAAIILAIVLWGIHEIAPPDMKRLFRIIAIGVFLIFVIVRGLPLLGVS
jgi:hypothetical protein